jgi:hypothetical protein
MVWRAEDADLRPAISMAIRDFDGRTPEFTNP